MNEVPIKMKERLSFIEFLLRFKGSASRADLIEKFGIKESAATKDFKAYRTLAGNNLSLDQKTKHYLLNENDFSPLFSLEVRTALSKLRKPSTAQAIGLTQMDGFSCPPRLSLPKLDVLAVITRGIATESKIEIQYFSPKSGESSRVIVPHAIVDNGLRWHIRAFDRKRMKFSDFVLTRCTSAKILNTEIEEEEKKSSDHQWNRMVELELRPHPNIKNVPEPIAIIHDYNMEDGKLKLMVRAAVAGYWLRLWNIDCSPDHSLKGPEYQLWLSNSEALYGVDSLKLAPLNKTLKRK